MMMTSIITRRSWKLYFTFLTIVFLLFVTIQNFYRIEITDHTEEVGTTSRGLGSDAMYGCYDSPPWQNHFNRRASKPPIAGYRRIGQKFLSIGISTVWREENYLRHTLESLVIESDPEEREDAVVVIYLADTDVDKREKQLHLVRKYFQPHLDSGFFQVIASGPEIYPPMDFALKKRTFNDSLERVLWRTKQVIDFAFLFTFVQPLSMYHLVIDDDVISSTQYTTAVKDFIKSRENNRWVALHFTGFLGIGLLFHNSDLSNLIKLLIMFHQDQPVDMLMRQFIALQVPDEIMARRIPSIFQHIGYKSTLQNKVQSLKDNTFDMAKRRYKNHNPPADIITSMKVYNDFVPEYAYRPTPGIFWGIPKPQDTVDIIFSKPLNISRVVVLSGVPSSKKNKTLKDTVTDGKLEVSSFFDKVAPNNSAICTNFSEIGEFFKGEVDVWGKEGSDGRNFSQKLNSVQCLRLKVGKGQKNWIIFKEIQVFL